MMRRSRQDQTPSKKTHALPEERVIALLLDKFYEIERNWDHNIRRKTGLKELKLLLESIETMPFIKRLHKHINESMDLALLYALLVPVERQYGNLNITDSHFLSAMTDGKSSPATPAMPVTVMLDNIRSAFNIGAIFRTSECFSIMEIILGGYSATPENPKITHSAMGTHQLIKWSHVKDIKSAIQKTKQQGVEIVALETIPEKPAYHEIKFQFPCALLLGNERFGLSQETLQACDRIVNIPVSGTKNSLNIACAFAICAAELHRQWNSIHGQQK